MIQYAAQLTALMRCQRAQVLRSTTGTARTQLTLCSIAMR